MRILFDVLGYLTESRNRGIGRYTRELVLSLNEASKDHEIHVLINRQFEKESKETFREFTDIFGAECLHFWAPIDTSNNPHDIDSEMIQISRDIYRAKIEEISPAAIIYSEPFTQTVGCDPLLNSKVLTFPIVYDLIPAVYPEDYLTNPEQKKWYENKMLEVGEMDTILTISQSSQVEIESLIPGSNKVVSIGCDTSSRFDISDQVFETINGVLFNGLDYIFYTGGYDYRKSVDLLIKAYADISKNSKKDIHLVLAGKIPELQKLELVSLAKRLNCSDSLIVLDYVKDEELTWLYQNCSLYVSPSRHEGFGLPILEAMRCGCPVLAADNTNTNELLEIDEAKFRTDDLEDLIKKINLILTNDEIKEKIIQYCKHKEKQYSWSSVAKKALHTIETISIGMKRKNKQKNSFKKLVQKLSAQNLNDDLCRDVALAINKSITADKPQLLVDISILIRVDSKTGVQRVVRSLLRELLLSNEISYSVRPVYFCYEANDFKYAEIKLDKGEPIFQTSTNNDVIDLYKGDIFLGLDLNHNVIVNHKAAFEKVIYSPAETYFVVYDLLPVKYPDFFDKVHNLTSLHMDWLKGISEADGIICISKVVCDDFSSFAALNQIALDENFKNKSFNLGSDILQVETETVSTSEFSQFSEIFANRSNVLMVGTLEPRKGHEVVLNAFHEFWKEHEANLIIVGGRGWKSESLQHKIANHPLYEEKLFWFEGLSDQGLHELYKLSDGLIAASIDEGYGLPIIEAAKNDLPVLARDIPVFNEVGGSGVSYFIDDSPARLSKDILNWVQAIEKGNVPDIKNVRCISWKESSQQLMQHISRVT